jgi:periplasmic divalent cation tolerance protein
MRKACVVMTTVADRDAAEALARAVLEARLAACVQVQPIASYYRRQGRIETGAEHLLYFKTTAERYDALERKLLELHSYDTPEIVRLPVDGGSSSYLAWIADETAPE